MRLRTVTVAMVGIVALLLGLPLEASAGGVPPGTLADCQTAHPSGAPLSMTIDEITIGPVPPPNGPLTLVSLTLQVNFRAMSFGPFGTGNVNVSSATNQMDAACLIFSAPSSGDPTMSLSDEIVSAVGLRGTLNFTACSLLGAASPDCTLNAPAGTINTPVGWLGGQITGYVGH